MQQCDAHERRVLLGKTLYVVLNLQAYVRDFLDLARLRGDAAPPCCQALQVQSLLQGWNWASRMSPCNVASTCACAPAP